MNFKDSTNTTIKTSDRYQDAAIKAAGLAQFDGTTIRYEYMFTITKSFNMGYSSGYRENVNSDHYFRIFFGDAGESLIIRKDDIKEYEWDGKTFVTCFLGKQEYPAQENYDMGDGRFLEFSFQ